MKFLDRLFGPPSRHRFARMVREGIARAGETRRLVYDSQRFRLSTSEADGPVMNLGNMYEEFCSVPREIRPQVVKNTVRNWFIDRREMPDEFPDAQPDLLPVVRARSYYEFTQMQLEIDGSPGPGCPYQPLAEHLAVGLVYDMPESMRLIQDDDLTEWNISLYQALETARLNLEQMTEMIFVSPAQGVYLSATGDNYDASRMLLTDLMRKFEVRGELVLMVPNRDTLIVGGSDDDHALQVMAGLAERASEQPRLITTLAFRLEGDQWQPWLPDRECPHYGQFRMLQIKAIGQDYAEQGELLSALYRKRGDDTYISAFSATQNSQTGAIDSYCVWSEGVPSILPRADRVFFFRPDPATRDGKVVAAASWEDVEQTVGDLLEPLDIYPARYRVTGFPNAAQLQMLGPGLP